MKRPFGGNRTGVSSLVGGAILVGLLVGFGLSTVGYGVRFQFSQSLSEVQTLSEETVLSHEAGPEPPHTPPDAAESDLQYLVDMVSKTNGFYARDYSLWLGWNNMRYIIESAILHGRILNRTTIIPSYVYARACEFDVRTCAAFVTMVNRGDATRTDEWRDLPIEQQMGWQIPISIMFNLTHLQQSHAVITTEDYLRLHNISADVEATDGQWNIDAYHVRDARGDLSPSLHVIENAWYDLGYYVRVDRIPEDMRLRGGWSAEGGDPSRAQVGSWTSPPTNSEIYVALMGALPGYRPVLSWDEVRRIVTDGTRITPESSAEEIGDVLHENGFEVVYTYDGAAGFDAVKDVALPIYQAVPRDKIRGLYEDFYDIPSRVLLARGELHGVGRKPGSLYFTSAASRARFSQTALYEMRLVDDIMSLAEQLSARMFALNGGRLWMSAHMRRGDFVELGWVKETEFGAHLARIQQRLEAGRGILASMHGGNATTYDVPGVQPDPLLVTLDPPLPGDKYYIATDERDPTNLDTLRSQNAVLITDLLTTEDHRTYGWPILLTDVLALVEQSVMARAAYFYAHATSSFAGGTLNLRAGLGRDPRTALIE